MRKVKVYKCNSCKKVFNSLQTWTNHVVKMHPKDIPEGYTPARYFYLLQTGKKNGNCIVCKNPTEWNEGSYKYERFCRNPECKKKYREVFKNRMVDKYGKTHLLNDPDKQREMVSKRKISGKYKFDDGGEVPYVGSYEQDFLSMLDNFLDYSSNDIIAPSPHTYKYIYKNENDRENEGEKFYIPDFYIPSLNLEIEIKSATNKHHKIQAIDKVKEKCKDDVMVNRSDVRYIKINDKDYKKFFELLLKLKEIEVDNENERF